MAYSCLSAEDSTNSEKEKKTVLNAFELDPEAYMQVYEMLLIPLKRKKLQY